MSQNNPTNNIKGETAELEQTLFQAPDKWFEVHTLSGEEIECAHLSKEGISAIIALIARERTQAAQAARREEREKAALIIRKYFTWPPGAFSPGATPHAGNTGNATISQRVAELIMQDAEAALAALTDGEQHGE